ncbi:MAG: tetratricopeptide repeat protein [Candidatus Komeilibacteria bacterium]|nr:tetratricopeptide repeat protein [Candidatus Komeilibacteria bacterium]
MNWEKIKIFSSKYIASPRWSLLWLLLLSFLVYGQTISYDYHYLDDNVLIKDAYFKIKDLTYIDDSFQEGAFHAPEGAELYYRPLLTISFILDAQWGGSLVPFHITDIVLHALTAWLLFLVLIKMKLPRLAALLFTLVFTLHPLNLQAIAWLPGRNDPLLAIPMLAGWLFFLKYRHRHKSWSLGLFWLFYIIGLFTKETAVMLPALALLYLWLIERQHIFGKQSWLIGIPYLILTSGWWWLRGTILPDSVSTNYDIIGSLSANFPAVIPYLGKMFLPFNVSTFPVLSDLPLIYGLIVIVGLAFLLKYSRNVNWRLVIFGAAWWLLFLLPSFLRPLSSLADFSEHRVYLSWLGIILILWQINFPWFVNKYRRHIGYAIVTVFLILITLVNITHAKVYKNSITFWQDAVDNSPNSSFNRNNLGAMHYLAGNYSAAAREWQVTLRLNPNEPLTHNNLGLIYAATGEYELAEEYYLRELTINPNYTNAHFNLGLLYYNNYQPDKAAELWIKTLQLNPEYFDAYQYLALYYMEKDELDKAQELLRELVARGGIISPQLESYLE